MSDQNNQFYIAVCDDEEQDIEKLGKLSDEIMREEGIASAFSYYKDGKCLLEAIQKGEAPRKRRMRAQHANSSCTCGLEKDY